MNAWAHLFGRGQTDADESHLTLADVPEGEDPDGVLTVSDSDFSSVVSRFDTVVIDCWAPWCMPCLMVAPVVKELAKDYKGRIIFGKLNVDECQRTAAKFRIQSIPTLLLFKGGKLVDGVIGALPKDRLEAWLKERALSE